MTPLASQRELVSAAVRLGANTVAGWSPQEAALATDCDSSLPSDVTLEEIRERICAGEDPLGCAFMDLRDPSTRRSLGATYTPAVIVDAMLAWAVKQFLPERIVDPGSGSGRFLLRAARLFPEARLVGVEIDPLAALIARANLATCGFASRTCVQLNDYRSARLRSGERTLFVGNPPYVRHHLIEPRWKAWALDQWRSQGIAASCLAGLHVHFFLATLLNANIGDCGAFVTAAEWLDVNYGSSLRRCFLARLGGLGLIVVEPTAAVFPGAATTAAITLFRVGSRPATLRLRRIRKLERLDDLSGGEVIDRNRFESEPRWSRLTAAPRPQPQGYVELGELCRVHRGQATGGNAVWIIDAGACRLPGCVLFSAVTRAREIIAAGRVLSAAGHLRKVIDLPEDLAELDPESRQAVEEFLRQARLQGADASYVARHRHVWWSVGLRPAAPILATYMARRAPVFTRNAIGVRHLNIAHGLYPRQRMTEPQLAALVDYLSQGVNVFDGRTYAGGLTKFEPREMERIPVPEELLTAPRGG